jgi:hypothetical protein
MSETYYAVRRFCPYLGVIQVIDVGDARAFSRDGEQWQVRVPSAGGPTSLMAAMLDLNRQELDGLEQLRAAVDNRPELPFPLEDRFELWLLRKSNRMPMALLKTRRLSTNMEGEIDPHWQPFLLQEQDFFSPTLERELVRRNPKAWPVSHIQLLERLINEAARPLPIAQWFERRKDGTGIGFAGLRVSEELLGRELGREDFPEMLLDERWESERDRQVVRDFHDWYAAPLLAHQSLSRDTRARLEKAAAARPGPVLEHYAMYPEILDQEGMDVALVKARLLQSAGG